MIEVTDNLIVVIDTTDNIWDFEGNGFKVNDEVILEMNTNCTDSNICDDIIENVKIK